MSKEAKKPKQKKSKGNRNIGSPEAAVEAANQPHNAKKEALGKNTKM